MGDGDLVLVDGEPEIVAWLLEGALRTAGRNGVIIRGELRQLATATAIAAPAAEVVKMRALLAAAGPEVAAAVKAQASGIAGSADGAGVAELAGSGRASLSATTAARLAGVSSRAVREACADGRLPGRKSRITGGWRIAPAALREWMEERRAA
jgi:Helix-turn-helix domain